MSNNQNINISQQNRTGTCDLKCAYQFKYQVSNSIAKNNGSFISLTYDNGSTPPVLFNNKKYNVSTINIVTPSIHLFNNNQVSAEIYIEHTPALGGSMLLVCIPITSSTSSSPATDLLTQIIQKVSTNAPSSGDKTNLNISNFTLENIVPKKPFYNYNDTNNNNWIVFDIANSITISDAVLNTLKKLIKPFSMNTQSSELFYNSNGPNVGKAGDLGDGIYISCQPTDSSEEETNVSFQKDQTDFNLNNLFDLNNPYTMIIINILIGISFCVVIYYFLNFGYHKITDNTISAFPILNPIGR